MRRPLLATAVAPLCALLGLTTAALAGAGPIEGYAGWEVTAIGKVLAKRLEMPSDRSAIVFERVKSVLGSDEFKAKYSKRITGIFAYQFGEGGAIVKVISGKGMVSFKYDEETDAKGLEEIAFGDKTVKIRVKKLKIKSTTVGASIGGSSQWGLGLVIGLRGESGFGGKYKGTTYGGAIGTSKGNVLELHPAGMVEGDAGFHALYLVGAASGATASASAVTFNIDLE